MIKHNSYFDGAVQSLGFARHGRSQSIGVIEPGKHEFTTAAAERMTVVSGELVVTQKGATKSLHYPKGTCFEVPGESSFVVEVAAPTAYLCEYF